MGFLSFLSGKFIWVYLFIFFGKILDVSIATVRMVLINRGERTKGSIIALFEVALWVIVTGTVLTGFTEDVWKVVLYCVAFALGNYVGSRLEAKLAFGLSTIQVIADRSDYQSVSETLRKNNLAVTEINGKGKEGDKKILLIHLKRSRIAEAVKLVNQANEKCVITVTDLRVVRGGFIKK
jgi:uncharacterized protein YebE (UPF0316 family)